MSLKEALKDKLREEELKILRRSFEIVGNVAIIEIPDELMHRSDLIVSAILSRHKNVKTVLRKVGEVSGAFRVAKYEKLHGEETETIAKEYGCRFLVDPTKAYFSSKLSTERERIAKLVKDGERVLVMFAGVGPYAIVIAKLSKPREVVGVELNSVAVDYFRKNIKLNKVTNVVAIEGDVAEIVPKLEGKFDRILMPAPYSAKDFVHVIKGKIVEGGFVHYYTFESENCEHELPKKVEEFFLQNQMVVKTKFMRRCGNFAPYVNRYVLDLKYIKDV